MVFHEKTNRRARRQIELLMKSNSRRRRHHASYDRCSYLSLLLLASTASSAASFQCYHCGATTRTAVTTTIKTSRQRQVNPCHQVGALRTIIVRPFINRRQQHQRQKQRLLLSSFNNNEQNDSADEDDYDDNNFVDFAGSEDFATVEDLEEKDFLRTELQHLEDLQELLSDLEDYPGKENDDEDANDDGLLLDPEMWDPESLTELFGSIPEFDDDEEEEEGGDDDDDDFGENAKDKLPSPEATAEVPTDASSLFGIGDLESALQQGVVPVDAGVGSNTLPGDFNWDPLQLSTKDYFLQTQQFILNLLPASKDDDDDEKNSDKGSENQEPPPERPAALILRDYREAEIRHGRLAMLAAVIWPLQELLDRYLLPEDVQGPLIDGHTVTLPYFPLLMTACMLLLGYLDIFSQSIKEMDKIGDAYQPGDCFWDPLSMLQGADARMRRNMAERELFNGRFAMVAVAVFIWEEAVTGKTLVNIPGNELLLEPAYQVPYIKEWLDALFVPGSIGPPSPLSSLSYQDLLNILPEDLPTE